jgi:hypothetical protein
MAGIARVNGKVSPGSFIGREIKFYKVKFADTKLGTSGGYGGVLDQANFDSIITTVQTHAEIFYIGTPTKHDELGQMMVGIALDTLNDGNDTVGNVSDNDLSETVTEALRANTFLNDNDIAFVPCTMLGPLFFED